MSNVLPNASEIGEPVSVQSSTAPIQHRIMHNRGPPADEAVRTDQSGRAGHVSFDGPPPTMTEVSPGASWPLLSACIPSRPVS